MVLEVVNPSLREASCCKFEVVNGGAGDFLRSPRLTLATVNCAARTRWITASQSSWLFSVAFSPFCPW